MILWVDNQAANSHSSNIASFIKAKLADIRLRFVRADVVKQIIAPRYVNTSKMIADLHKGVSDAKISLKSDLWQLRYRTKKI